MSPANCVKDVELNVELNVVHPTDISNTRRFHDGGIPFESDPRKH